MRCLAGCVLSSVIGGKILTGGDLEERISLAFLTFICVVSEVLAAVFFFVGGRSCQQGSERFSSPSDFPCQLSSFSSFRPRGFSDKVGLNQPIMREVLGKLMRSAESDVLTESVTEDSADDYQITRKQLAKRAKKVLKRLKSRVGSKTVNQRVIKSKANAVVASLAKVSRPK